MIDIKDWLLNGGPLRSSTKCCKCQKGAVWEPKEEGLPFYCEDHAPWRPDPDESVDLPESATQ